LTSCLPRMTLVPFLILSLVMCPASRQVSYDTCHPRLVSVSSWSRHFPPTHCPFVYAHAPFKARCATENRVCHEQGVPRTGYATGHPCCTGTPKMPRNSMRNSMRPARLPRSSPTLGDTS